MEDLATLLARRFIQRRDVKAIQMTDGGYRPHTDSGLPDGRRLPWRMTDISDHLEGRRTYGHYLLDAEDRCKLFAFDVDLEPTGHLPSRPYDPIEGDWPRDFQEVDLRAAWRNRRHPGRAWMKYQFRTLAERLAGIASKELGLPVALAYSGAKGVHTYCFAGALYESGSLPASDAVEGARLVLDVLDEFEPCLDHEGRHLRHRDRDPYTGYPNLSVEIFPKQTSVRGGGLGNLMRLPLGRNLKTTDPTFFLDLHSPPVELAPADPVVALACGDPWSLGD